MKKRFVTASGLIALTSAATMAQTTAASAPDKAAMERAQKQADGPMRRILEVARAKAAPRSADPVAIITPAPAAVTSAVPGQLPAPAPSPVPTRSMSPSPNLPEPVLAVLPGAGLPLRTSGDAPVAIVAPVATPEIASATVSMINVPTAEQLAALPPPRLLSKVEPDLPPRLLRRGADLLIDVVVGTDGSVLQAKMRPGTNAEFEGPVLEAVRQWRYERQPAAREYLVRMVVTY